MLFTLSAGDILVNSSRARTKGRHNCDSMISTTFTKVFGDGSLLPRPDLSTHVRLYFVVCLGHHEGGLTALIVV